jgi:hypothetical protein
MKKENHTFTVAEALDLILANKKISKGLHESVIRQNWTRIMGETIASHTGNIYLRGTELHIYFNSSIVRNEVMYNKQKAIDLINEELGDNIVADLVIR